VQTGGTVNVTFADGSTGFNIAACHITVLSVSNISSHD